MQATDASTLFQTDEALAQGAARASKASRTATGSEYGHPIWLGSRYKDSIGLAESGAGADAGSARVLSLRCRTVAASTAAPGARQGPLPQSQAWTAESGGVVRLTDLETGKTAVIFRGHSAPVPTFDIVRVGGSTGGGRESTREVLVTGSWDKSIKVWSIPSHGTTVESAATPLRPKPILTQPQAATDFIKAVHCFRSQGRDFVLSAGSDKTVRCWHLTPLLEWTGALSEADWTRICTTGTSEGERATMPDIEVVAMLREHTRPINCLGSVPPPPRLDASAEADADAEGGQTTLFSADSMGRIFEMVLNLPASLDNASATATASAASRGSLTIRRELRAHETAIYDLRAGWRDEEVEGLDSLPSAAAASSSQPGEGEGDDEFVTPIYEAPDGSFRRHVAEVWTCSGDKTARCFVLSPTVLRQSGRGQVPGSRTSKAGAPLGSQPPLGPSRTIQHADFVKSLVSLGHAAARRRADVGSAADLALRVSPPPNVLATGSADETLRLFALDTDATAAPDAAAGIAPSTSSTAKPTVPIAAVEGHWHEIDAIDVWLRPRSGPLQGPTTSSDNEPIPPATAAGQRHLNRDLDLDDLDDDGERGQDYQAEEEERELAELMGSDDEDL
ncbi:uncharacterized protein PSFLO_04078 [Pseudozyma flocculosa]|uniref:WD40 repeat-like protein n=1 Tax=Pseudozyma flocculosa TaxID=84751 RepID=A0A5C3F3C4_9BASI|nr:uncharacterized protein PSFLO_04078 [Pseudozyma flocculosa]